ncbi:type II secretion system protein F (plasmid) [Frondihabitans sucicola]|uniref:Type II secretion system protein F n=1 Tax=Frondihabitans sucicola TaxID=1268041 RepID=A0ABN6Y912_9MICO|nr:type II secretion system F family protein [Frondihabitans sucicola]BDZ52488.1 type II secretion system protein F [Frondihabitans sucicola]
MSIVTAEKKFNYKARDNDGIIRHGTGQASSRRHIVSELTKRGWTPLDVREGGASLFTNFEITLRKRSKATSLVVGIRQLAACLEAGLPLPRALEIMGESEDQIFADGVRAVARDVEAGNPLSVAMRRQPNAFPSMIPDMLAAGEAGGYLAKSAGQVADSIEADDNLRKKVKKALSYPTIVMSVSALIFIFMMVYIVPTFANLYESMSDGKVQLPALTRAVVAVSDSMIWLLPTIGILGVAFFFWYRKYGRTEKVREVWDPMKLKIPVFGKLFHLISLSRFTRNFGALLSSGVPIQESLRMTAEIVNNIRMERAILAARDEVLKGKSLVEPLKDEPDLFPNMAIQFIYAGQESGETPQMLQKASAIYDRDVNTITDNLTALIEPLFIVVLAFMVGTLAIAIYLPYLNIGNLMDAS